MPEITAASGGETARLEARARKLAREKSFLQLSLTLMNRLSAVPGLENTVGTMLEIVLDSIGGANVIVYYFIDDDIHCADVFGGKKQLDRIDDDLVNRALETREFVEIAHAFSDTKMLTPEFTSASSCAIPLLVGPDIIGILKLEGMFMAVSEVRAHFQPFFNYAALVLKNEISGHTKLKKAYDQLSETNAALTDEIVKHRETEARLRDYSDALAESHEKLQRAYNDLKDAQTRLLQQDKMASIGQLAAGVAHEINNPMAFIISNLSSLGKYVEKLAAYMDEAEKLLAEQTPALLETLERERKRYKIDRIRGDLPELLAESLDGAARVRRIVQDLKSFSRVDRAECSSEDMNQAMESTLSIAWNEIKYKATVIKEYGQLPPVLCNPGQINQVFLNILINAAHAIETRGEIRIRTWADGESVHVEIGDTGRGIPQESMKRIFDPFFTTKEVGKGTGLGLAIAYDIIVNKHGGRIDVKSEEGTGTTFMVTLPLVKPGCVKTNG
ncbi:MAG: hypothetical protein HZA20_04585 [Nitrospirae bacterium]|nr:hypothetical protein [Nitrospirota bacterium]